VNMLQQAPANDPPPTDPKPTRAASNADDGETLGHRKMIARTATGAELTKLMQDPHPEVAQNVLQNAHVTEELVIRMAARRPVGGGVLDAIARSRFQNSALVRRAVVLNPDCPQKLAQRLVAQLSPVDLHDVVHAPGVAKEIKTIARRLLDSR
jgi:tRNA nucleotidyltransferase/poly(A) polymerase